MKKRRVLETTSFFLHVLAMGLMLLDHMWATVTPGNDWMTCLGRMAYPIFAFMIVEGYFHTHDLKKYMLRMLIFAVVSEIPFDIMYSGLAIYPYHQNVMWTFLISLVGMYLIDEKIKPMAMAKRIILSAIVVIVTAVLGLATMADYYSVGVLMVYVFYFFRERKWWAYAAQLVLMYWLNVEILGGYYYNLELFGHNFEIIQQGIAMFALVPIWLYRGKQGYHSKWFQYFCYGFYPVHTLILGLICLSY